MHISYDREHNIAYIRLQPKQNGAVRTLELSGDMNVDLAPDGSVYGIELLNANEQLRADGNMVQLFNLNNNLLRELPL